MKPFLAALALLGLSAPAAALKPQLSGLLDRQKMPEAAYAAVMGGWVVNVPWAELEPQPGQLAPNNELDRAIAAARAWNRAHPSHPLFLKLRVVAGIESPDWVKARFGPPLAVTSPQSGAAGTVPRFWTPDFMAAYAKLHAQLAAKYDAVPEFREVVTAGCTSVYAEPLIRQGSDRAWIRDLLAAGYTDKLDEACQVSQIDAARAWKGTRVSLSFNPYQRVSSAGKVTPDLAFTLRLMDECRARLGQQCVLANNSLRVAEQGQDYPQMYARMKALGAPLMFQTATLAKVGDLKGTLQKAVDLGAAAVELPTGYTRTTPADLAPFDTALRKNAK